MAQQACDWGLIGRKSGRTQQLDTYNPSGLVTRSQFVSILARLLYGYTYDENPSQALLVFKEIGYINDISAPNILERRGTMLLVLQRIAASWDKKVRTLNPELLGVRSLTGVYLPPVKTPVFT